MSSTFFDVAEQVKSGSGLTSAGLSVPSVSRWTPPTAEPPVRVRLTVDAGETGAVRTGRHVPVGCWATPASRVDGGRSVQQVAALDGPARC